MSLEVMNKESIFTRDTNNFRFVSVDIFSRKFSYCKFYDQKFMRSNIFNPLNIKYCINRCWFLPRNIKLVTETQRKVKHVS